VTKEQEALLNAHYAGAVPLHVLKSEMERTTRELDTAAAQIGAAEQSLEQFDEQLERALEVARFSRESYSEALPSERRLLIQGLFEKLLIAEDGSVEDAEVQGLFAGLLSRDTTIKTDERETILPPPKQKGTTMSGGEPDCRLVPATEWGTRPERRWSPTAVLLSFQSREGNSHAKTPPKLSFGRGSNKAHQCGDGGI
jgi:hypothetical protein